METDFTALFDNFDLNTIPNVYFYRRNPNDEAPTAITAHELVRRDGSVVTSVKRGNKIIDLQGYIVSPSRTSFEEALDILKYRTAGVEKPLVLIQAGNERKYTATKENIVVKHIEAGKAEISLAFRSSNPFGSDTALTLYSTTSTTTPKALSHIFLGSAPAKPIITITVTSMTGGTTKYVGVGNSSTGQQVQTKPRVWVNGDVVQFNLATNKVYINAVVSDYDGVFPTFSPFEANAYYVDNLTTRNITIEMSYVKQYL